MAAIRIKQRIESENLHLPLFKNFIGKNVEVIVLIEPEETPKPTNRVPGYAKGLISFKRKKQKVMSEIRNSFSLKRKFCLLISDAVKLRQISGMNSE